MRGLVIGLLLLSLAVAGGVSYLASEAPDGLEHSLEKHGVSEGESAIPAPMPDYQAPFGGQLLAGISGTLAVFGLTLLVGRALRKRREKT